MKTCIYLLKALFPAFCTLILIENIAQIYTFKLMGVENFTMTKPACTTVYIYMLDDVDDDNYNLIFAQLPTRLRNTYLIKCKG